MKREFAPALGAMVCAGIVATAGADVVMDNIGAMDGSNMAGNIGASQHFEAAYAQYSIGAHDDFTLAADTVLNSVSFVLGGWNGYAGTAGVLGYHVNVHSDMDSAGVDLIGDVLNMQFASASASADWTGTGDHMTLDLGGALLGAGTYHISVIPENAFASNGQTGIYTTLTGGDNGHQSNPGGGFGFGPYQMTGANYAYSLDGSPIPGPAALSLLGIAGLCVRRRR
ncbi:MAG: hypothetical protein QGH76_02550 [Phycisphaerales bacterium]|jgi:MYXO-CTERM domain-containing protein|nr:hypothetical protein [Phycisphaerales bacterium]